MLSKENEQLDMDLSQTRHDLEFETKNKRKLEQVLREAAAAMKLALTVSSVRCLRSTYSYTQHVLVLIIHMYL